MAIDDANMDPTIYRLIVSKSINSNLHPLHFSARSKWEVEKSRHHISLADGAVSKRDLFPPLERNKSSDQVDQSENGGGHDKSASFYPNEIHEVGVWRQKKDMLKEKNRGHIQ